MADVDSRAMTAADPANTLAEAATDPVVADGEPSVGASAPGYALGAVLGRGGMGEVVLARDGRIGRDVALKRMRGGAPSEDATARFLREAKIQARLDHPAIVPVHELGRDVDGRPYFTMKRLAGTTLLAKLERGDASQTELLRALVDVAHAIELAHARGVVHRDLKPANIMLGDYGEVYVLDWGIARVLGTAEGGTPDIDSVGDDVTGTQAGALLGTPGYMPPEQVRGEPVGPPADIYALGATLFEILAGAPVHPRGAEAIVSTLEGGRHSPAAAHPARGIPPELDALCTAALAASPGDRPSARAFADGLQRYLDGDRDVEARRALAVAQLAIARAALASRDPARRGEAVHAAGRALALDPGALDAAALVTSLIVEPPAQMPPELAIAVRADEAAAMRRRSKRAIAPFASFAILTPFLPWGHADALPALIALHVMFVINIGVALVNWRVRAVPAGVFLAMHFATALAMSRLVGPFLIAPAFVCGLLLASTATPWINDRWWVVLSWTAAAMLAPFALEWAGVLAPTWSVGADGVVSHGAMLSGQAPMDTAVVIVTNVFTVVAISAYARRIARDRRDAQRELFVQAWHLRQLLPPEQR